jgi:hypothetical protein
MDLCSRPADLYGREDGDALDGVLGLALWVE